LTRQSDHYYVEDNDVAEDSMAAFEEEVGEEEKEGKDFALIPDATYVWTSELTSFVKHTSTPLLFDLLALACMLRPASRQN